MWLTLRKVFVIGTLLIVPTIFYILLLQGKSQFKPMAYVNLQGKECNADESYFSLKGEAKTDEGEVVDIEKKFDKRILLLSAINTEVDSSFRVILPQFYKLCSAFPALWQLKVLCFDVGEEGPRDFKSLRKRFLLHNSKLIFTKAVEPKSIAIVDSLFFPADDSLASASGFSNKFILIDDQKHIRGIYNGSDNRDFKRLNDEIKVLILEMKKR